MRHNKLNALRARREDNGLVQLQIAQLAGMSERHYQSVEYGEVTPNVHKAIRIADVLGVTDYSDFKKLFNPAVNN